MSVPNNMTTQTRERESRISYLNDIENTGQYWAIQDDIGQYWTIFDNFIYYWTILFSIIEYRNVSNNITNHLANQARSSCF